MAAMAQNIGQEELDRIATYILETRLAPAIEELIRKNEMKMKELSLIERVIRVEEELKALREIESARFEAIEKRFEVIDKRMEALQREIAARAEATDKRFEALQREMDKRFSVLQWSIGIGFSVLTVLLTLFRFYPR